MKKFILKVIWKLNKGSQPIFVSGSPRAGTSWIMEVLEKATGARVHWEPLNWYLYSIRHERLNGYQIALRPNDEVLSEDKRYSEELRRILRCGAPLIASSAKIANISSISNIVRIATSKITIIKFVFAQRALAWIADNSNITGCVILRHPAATVASQLFHPYKINGKLTPHPEWTTEAIQNTHPIYSKSDLKRFPRLTKALDLDLSCAGRLAVTACLDILHAIDSDNVRNSFVFVVYESLLGNPHKFEELVGSLGLELKRKLSISDIEERSRTTSVQNAESRKGIQRLSKSELDEIYSVMSIFNLDFYSENMAFDYSKINHLNFKKIIK